MGAKPDWEREARDAALEFQLPLDEGRDIVILDCLMQGDPQALAHFLRSGHELGPEVREYLATMLGEGKTPFRLVVERRTNKRRTRPFLLTASIKRRDGKAAMRMRELVVTKVKYDKAKEQAAEEFGINVDLVRKAYNRIYGKKLR
jgi:hypothetical protein